MKLAAEKELVERARRGEREALEALLAEVEPSVYRFGMKLCRDEETAREVLQETLLAAVRHLESFRGDAALSTWLYTVARSVCIKQRRKSKYAPTAVESLDDEPSVAVIPTSSEADDPDRSLERAELREGLQNAIAALEPIYREVLVLRDVEGLSAPEVAETLSLSVEAVKSRLHRARTRVRASLAPLLTADLPPGPDCPDIVPLLSARLESEVSPETCKEMETHLATCSRCSTMCDSLKQTLRLCQASATPGAVPPAVQEAVREAVEEFVRRHPPRST